MDLTPKKWKKKAPRKRSRTPLIVRHWRNPFTRIILAVALLSFVGSGVWDRLKQRRVYEEQMARAEMLDAQVQKQLAEAEQLFSSIQSQGERLALRDRPEDLQALDRARDELNRRLDQGFAGVNACYAAMAYRYRADAEVQLWFIGFSERCINSALKREEFEQARLWYNASHVNRFLSDLRPRVKGVGALEVEAGPDVYKAAVWPLMLDGPRTVLGDPLGSAMEFPALFQDMEKGAYLLWVTRADGIFAPYPVNIPHGQTVKVQLEVPPVIPEGTVFVPGGPFICGGGASPRWREHTRSLPSFFIAKTEVSIAEYLEFWKSLPDARSKADCMSRVRFAAGQAPVDAWDADGKLTDERLKPEYPVVGISPKAAAAFCAWKSRTTGAVVRLPTAFEWEKAARGVDGRAYPWGPEFIPEANLALTAENPAAKKKFPLWAPCGSFRKDVSVYNARDMGGSVREIVIDPDGGVQVRGGSLAAPAAFMSCTHVSGFSADGPSDIGFRYVREL